MERMSLEKKVEEINSEYFLENELLSPFTYLAEVRGKQFGLKIPIAFNHWMKVPNDKLREVLNTIDMLQAASLLIDDIQDDSKVRRGMPAAHCVFGVPLTINSSLQVICLVYQRAQDLSPKAGEIVMQHLLGAVRGQGYDIYWRDNFVCPTEEEYFEMVEKKTGARFLLTVELMQIFSKNTMDYSKLVFLLGRYFQIRDDYCNLTQEKALEEWLGTKKEKMFKAITFCEDITEGKLSFPIIHALKSSKSEEILSKRSQDQRLKEYCISLLAISGSLQYTRDKLDELDQAIRIEVTRLGDNPMMNEILDHLLSWKSHISEYS